MSNKHALQNIRVSFSILILTFFVITVSCVSKSGYTLNLMPAPQMYENEGVHPFSDTSPINPDNTIIIPYATDRQPAEENDKERYYINKSTHQLRLGSGIVKLGKGQMTWDELKKVSLLKNRTEKFPLKVKETKEYGILEQTIHEFARPEVMALKSSDPGRRFAELINQRLEHTDQKEIFIYVHGFKVNFENPLLVASELWHYMGYKGVFIPYAWPSTTSVWAYAKDSETTMISSRTFRIFLEYLSRETKAEKIHIVAYSAGSRLVLNTLLDMTMIHKDRSYNEALKHTKLGNVILVGSDASTDFFINVLLEGVLHITENIVVYQSRRDKALGAASWLFSKRRLGQLDKDAESDINLVRLIRDVTTLHIIDVSSAANAFTRNGHYYFRDSPWVSSDILTTLVYNLSPGHRGLARADNQFIWTFPENYIDSLKKVLGDKNAVLNSLD